MTLTYLGATRVLENYNVMGLAKASLEANVRYLASCLGPEQIRVNGISAGPIKTLAAAGIGGFSKILHFVERTAPLRRNVTTDEVGNVAAFLLSDLASAVTGEITYVDCGFSTVAAGMATSNPDVRARHAHRRMTATRAASTPSSSAAATTASPARRISRRRASRSACVERRGVLGGAAVTEEFHPGFRNSTASYTVSLLDPQVIRDLRLAEHGLVDQRAAVRQFPAAAGRAVSQGRRRTRRDAGGSREILARRRASAAGLLRDARARRRRAARNAPCHAAERRRRQRADLAAIVDMFKVGKRFRALSLPERRDVLDLFTKSAGDLLDRWFESAPIKAAFGFDAVVGNFASPYTPGSAYVLLHHVFGEVNGKRGQWGHARGGMGAITQAMAKECAARGVALRTDAPVARVIVEGGPRRGRRARGRRRSIEGARVVANVNPKLLFERLVAPEHVRCRFPRAHRGLSLRLRHVPDECRAVGTAGFHRAARQAMRSRITAAASSWRRRSPTWSARISTRARTGWSRRRSSRC